MNSVVPHDWAGFLRQRLTEKAAGAPLMGFTKSGYKLTYADTPTPFFKDSERRGKEVNLSYSLGITVGKERHLTSVIWGGPAFEAGLTTAADIVAVNGIDYTEDVIKAAITAAKGGTAPIRLTVKTGSRVRDVNLQWNGGLRYPRLEKVGTVETGLDVLLRAKP